MIRRSMWDASARFATRSDAQHGARGAHGHSWLHCGSGDASPCARLTGIAACRAGPFLACWQRRRMRSGAGTASRRGARRAAGRPGRFPSPLRPAGSREGRRGRAPARDPPAPDRRSLPALHVEVTADGPRAALRVAHRSAARTAPRRPPPPTTPGKSDPRGRRQRRVHARARAGRRRARVATTARDIDAPASRSANSSSPIVSACRGRGACSSPTRFDDRSPRHRSAHRRRRDPCAERRVELRVGAARRTNRRGRLSVGRRSSPARWGPPSSTAWRARRSGVARLHRVRSAPGGRRDRAGAHLDGGALQLQRPLSRDDLPLLGADTAARLVHHERPRRGHPPAGGPLGAVGSGAPPLVAQQLIHRWVGGELWIGTDAAHEAEATGSWRGGALHGDPRPRQVSASYARRRARRDRGEASVLATSAHRAEGNAVSQRRRTDDSARATLVARGALYAAG